MHHICHRHFSNTLPSHHDAGGEREGFELSADTYASPIFSFSFDIDIDVDWAPEEEEEVERYGDDVDASPPSSFPFNVNVDASSLLSPLSLRCRCLDRHQQVDYHVVLVDYRYNSYP